MTEIDASTEGFGDALEDGNFAAAASILRALPSLEHQDLELLADWFDPSIPQSSINRFRLYRVQRKPGGPRGPRRSGSTTVPSLIPREQVVAQDFFDAINGNDFALAATVLRALPNLKGDALNQLADLFDPDCPSNPYKLRRKGRQKAGRTSDPWRRSVRDTSISWHVNRVRKGAGKVEAAVAQVTADQRIQRSEVFKALRKRKQRPTPER